MLSEDELRLWLERSGLPEPARALIRRVRSSEPSRTCGQLAGQRQRSISEQEDGSNNPV